MLDVRKGKLLEGLLKVKELPFERIEEIAHQLIRSYGVLSLAAERLDLSELMLRNILSAYPELQQVREASLGGFKGLVDKEIVKKLEEGDSDILALVFRHLYGGRDKGGVNMNEFGSIGDEDKHFAGKDKVAKQGIHVHIHFTDDNAKRASDFDAIEIEDYIDIEPEIE
jgi:hypothetical protein